MFKFKRLVSTLMAITMSFTIATTSVFASVATDVAGTKFEEAAEVLGILDIMVGDAESGNFRPDDSIRRSEVAKVAVALLGLTDVADANGGPTKYPDVVSNHWANGFINIATGQGLVEGDDVGTFRPDDSISFAEAVTIMVRALGYEPAADAKGGFPTGYLVVGNDIGLTKGVSGSSDTPISRGNVAQLAFNALTIKMMEQVGFGNDINYEVVDKTILETKLDVEKIEGQVTAVGTSSIDGSSLKDGQIKIAGTVYDVAKADVRQVLGFNVNAYIKENNAGEKELLLARPIEGKNSAVTVKAEDIHEIVNETGAKTLSYWKDETAKVPTKLNIRTDANVMYNGKTGAFTDFKKITDGSISVLDTENDGIYDVVFVNETVNYVVEEVTLSSHKVVDKYGLKTLVLDPENDNLSFSIYKGSEKIDISDLNEWDVITVTQSKDGEVIYLEVSNDKVTGKVTEIDDKHFYIDGEPFKKAGNYTEKIELHDEGTFYLDIFGKIAAVDSTSTISSNYAYLVDLGVSTDMDKDLSLKLFTMEGETKVIKAANKVTVNGKSGLDAATALSEIGSKGKLITFETNADGKVYRVDTATSTSGAVNEDKFSLNIDAKGAVYKAASGKLVTDKGSVNVTKDTIVFDIPAGVTDSDKYAVRNGSFFQDEDKYDVRVFDMQEDMTAKAIIVTNSTGNANEESSILVVDRITQLKNEDGMNIEKLYAYQGGELVTYVTAESKILVKGGSASLEQGDIIQVKTNAADEITAITVLFDIDTKGTEAETKVSEDMTTYYGKVVKKFSGSFNLQVGSGAIHNFTTEGVDIYSVDTTKTSNQITVTDAGDIQKYDSDDGSLVFVRVYKDVVKEIVVIK